MSHATLTHNQLQWMHSICHGKTKIHVFLTFFSSCKIDFQNHSGESIGNHSNSMVADPKLVPNNDAVTRGLPHHSPTEESQKSREQITSTVP